MYRAWCRLEKNYVNPFTGRVGRWRVIRSDFMRSEYRKIISGPIFLALHTTTSLRKGTFINPTKDLKKVLAARKAIA